MSKTSVEHDHTPGENNIQLYGFDVHNPVFLISAVSIIIFVLVTLRYLLMFFNITLLLLVILGSLLLIGFLIWINV